MPLRIRCKLAVCAVLLVCLLKPGGAGAQENLNPINPLPGVKTWRWSEDGVDIRLTQIVPEQIRGFYASRGFGKNDVEMIASDCIFQTVIRNDAASAQLRVDLSQWRAVAGSTAHPPKLREDWAAVWRERNAPPSAVLASRWAFFPTAQIFDNGDWNMGMTSYGFSPGTQFDLEFSFTAGEQRRRGEIKNIECAKDTIPQ